LWVNGYPPRSYFLAVIRNTFDLIHQNSTNLEVKSILPLDKEGKDEISSQAAHNWIKKHKNELYFHAESEQEYNLLELLGHYSSSNKSSGDTYYITVEGDNNGVIVIDQREQTINLNSQQLAELSSFKDFLNNFLSSTQNQLQQSNRQQINELTDWVGFMLVNKTVPEDKSKFKKLLTTTGAVLDKASKIAGLAEKAGKCIPYLAKIGEWI
jgi:hypothetical protein